MQKRQYQAGFEDWSTYLQPKVVGSSNVVTIDPATGEVTAAVVPDILTVAAQRSLAAAEYNELVSQAGGRGRHPTHTYMYTSSKGSGGVEAGSVRSRGSPSPSVSSTPEWSLTPDPHQLPAPFPLCVLNP